MNEAHYTLNKKVDAELLLFHETFNRLYGKLYNFSSYYLYDKEEAKEIIQDVFLKFWEGNYSILELHRESKLDSLLFTMAKNRCLDVLKHKRVETKFAENKRDEYIKQSISLHALSDDSSLNLLIGKDTELAIKKAIMELPKPIREAFIMSRYHSLSYKEIAKNQLVSEKTVEYRISIALKELRGKLSPYCYMILMLLYR